MGGKKCISVGSTRLDLMNEVEIKILLIAMTFSHSILLWTKGTLKFQL